MKKFKLLILLCIMTAIFVLAVNLIITKKSQTFIHSDFRDIPGCYTGIIPGAMVSPSGTLSNFLQDRVDAAIQLYKAKKIKRFLLTGDHGRTDYDEVNSMKEYLIGHGINTDDIFLDHAGFDTYSSLYRAKKIFEVKDAIIVSQQFHLPRAVYIARNQGINAYGFIADKRKYSSIKQLKIRETLANIKAYIEVLVNKKPRFLGEKIPITGDSKLSYD